jgi:hypothetical protein
MDAMAAVRARGATAMTVQDVEYVFDDTEPLAAKLFSALPKT